MKLIADLHIHSHYSLATSKQLTPPYLDFWAKIKGVNIVGTGDFTHPKWLNEIKTYLEPAEDGLLKLKKEYIIPNNPQQQNLVRFILSAEISNIYKKNGKVRKIHNVILAPSIETVEKIQQKLIENKFNIFSDGRPILGLDARDLLEMLLEIDPNIIFIPAHIWTPWFALLGSKSGFDNPQECFGDMTKYIKAVETGLSSDLPMNWLCSFLDDFNLISNSDAHSPEKLGRNANIFDIELSYFEIKKAIENQDNNNFIGTIDLYPQEGKYHYDGHRKCGIRWDPVQTLEHNGICPVCGKPVTLGVAHRVASLADRADVNLRPIRKKFKYLIPLKEIISEILSVSPNSKSVDNQYFSLINKLGSELQILFEIDIQTIARTGGEILAEAIKRMRENKVFIEEGFDGQYGKIKLFAKNELKNKGSNKNLFGLKITPQQEPPTRKILNFDVEKFLLLKQKNKQPSKNLTKIKTSSLTQEQQMAVESKEKFIFVEAGPGTGKTKTLTEKIAFLINQQKIAPTNILAVTFTNQAAEEMKKRLKNILKDTPLPDINTFHSYALKIIKNKIQNPIIIDDEQKSIILQELGVAKNKIQKLIQSFSYHKNTLNEFTDQQEKQIFLKYSEFLKKYSLFDLDDLIIQATQLLNNDKHIKKQFTKNYILIDEFQDINNAQYLFLKSLLNENTSIFAIGDPKQAIYAFRGSNPSIIDSFIQEFNAKKITLSYSFRCTDNILKASAQIVKSEQILKGKEKGVKINIVPQQTQKSEAEFIARTIEKLIGGVRFFSIDSNITQGYENTEFQSLSEFAILTRTKNQHTYIIKALNDHGIPYQVIGEQPFYKQKPFSDILNILQFIKYPDNQFIKSNVKNFIPYIKNLKSEKEPIKIISSLWNNLFAKDYKEKTDEYKRFINIIKDKSLDEIIEYMNLSMPADDYSAEIENVKIMTLHASKGLEFSCVFIAGCTEGFIPYTLFKKDVDIQEERRLFYVATTRAKKLLYLTYPKVINIQNKKFKRQESRFIKEIEKELTQQIKSEVKSKKIDYPKLF